MILAMIIKLIRFVIEKIIKCISIVMASILNGKNKIMNWIDDCIMQIILYMVPLLV